MPILSDNLLFIHIPKNAGTYVEESFGLTKFDINRLYDQDTYHIVDGIKFSLQHMNCTVIKKLNLINHEKLEKMYKFTIIRNPYTRALSEYFWFNMFIGNKLNKFDSENFNEFVKNILSIRNWDHRLPQSFYFDVNYDKVFRYETFLDEFSLFVNKFGIKKLPDRKINSTNYDKNELLNRVKNETIDILNELYKDDFELLNYSFI